MVDGLIAHDGLIPTSPPPKDLGFSSTVYQGSASISIFWLNTTMNLGLNSNFFLISLSLTLKNELVVLFNSFIYKCSQPVFSSSKTLKITSRQAFQYTFNTNTKDAVSAISRWNRPEALLAYVWMTLDCVWTIEANSPEKVIERFSEKHLV